MAQASPESDGSAPQFDDFGESCQSDAGEIRVRAEVRLLVARDAPGDLATGARALLGRVDAVRAVEDLRISGMRPGLNDLRVDATVTLRLAATDDPATTLTDGFGVARADVLDASA